jgi:hypothetical protein
MRITRGCFLLVMLTGPTLVGQQSFGVYRKLRRHERVTPSGALPADDGLGL